MSRHLRPVRSAIRTFSPMLIFVLLAAAITSWIVVQSPNLGTTNFLYGVAAISPSNVWAVGYSDNGSTQLTLTEHWNGTNWSIVSSPSPGTQTRCGTGYSGNVLEGVTAIASNNVWAVGHICGWQGRTLVEHWDGIHWTVVPSSNVAGADMSTLVSVAAVSANDVWAVGNFQVGGQYQWNTLVEHWNGTKWNIVNSPNGSGKDKNFLNAIAVVSPTNLWAVGYSEDDSSNTIDVPLIEHYNGGGWSIVPSVYPAPSAFNALYGITALSATNIWAVGYANENSQGQNGAALIEYWNGTNWKLVNSPIAGSATILTSIAPNSSTDIWAAGYIQSSDVQYLPITEHWNGNSWAVVNPPNPGKVAQLFSADTINGQVWAVGAYSKSAMTQGYMPNPLTLTIRR